MTKRKIKKISKKKTSTKRKIIKRKRNPEANINSLIPYKYYILSLDRGYAYSYYRIILFKDYDEHEIIWLNPKNFEIGFDEEQEIEKIWGPFNSLEESEDYGFRLPKGRWL